MFKKIFNKLILLMIISLILITFTTVLRDYIEVYKFKNHITKEYIINVLVSLSTYKNFFTIFDPPNLASWILIGMYIIYGLFDLLGGISNNSTYSRNEDYGSHGTSRWQTKKEIKENYYNNDKVGWFLGSLKSTPFNLKDNYAYNSVNGPLNMQINVVGPPGSEKTTGFVLPTIFHLSNIYSKLEEHADLIITDPKSELYAQTADFLESKGYDVYVLDFIHLKYGDKLNNLDFIDSDKELMEVAHGYIKSVSAGSGSSSSEQEFWDNQESQVLAALMGFVQQTRPKELQTMTEIVKILTSEEVSSIENAKYFFIENNIKGAALQLWNNFLMISESDRTRANILGGLSTKLKLFAVEGIQHITNSTTVNIAKLGAEKDKPMAIFILMPDGDRTFSPVINTVLTTTFNQLYKTAYLYNNKLANPVYILIEEAANIGYIPGLPEKLGTMRGRRIYPMMIWQSLPQLKDRYPKAWEDILSQCDTHVYLGVNEEFTARYVSNQLGNTTIRVQGLNQKKDGVFKGDPSQSLNYQQRKLLFEDEVMRFDLKTSIIKQRGRYPLKLKKVQYRYWNKKYKICATKSVYDLPLLSDDSYQIIENTLDEIIMDNELDKSHFIDSRDIKDKNNVSYKEYDQEQKQENKENSEYDIVSIDLGMTENNIKNNIPDNINLEIDLSALEELENELQLDKRQNKDR